MKIRNGFKNVIHCRDVPCKILTFMMMCKKYIMVWLLLNEDVEESMENDQMRLLSLCRGMDGAELCVVTPRGNISLCVLKFFRNGFRGPFFSVDVLDEAVAGDLEVDQGFLVSLFEFIEGSIFREFHGSESGDIHSLEVSWGSLGLNLVKYYGDRERTPLFPARHIRALSRRIN